jgi:hypothetical protein
MLIATFLSLLFHEGYAYAPDPVPVCIMDGILAVTLGFTIAIKVRFDGMPMLAASRKHA